MLNAINKEIHSTDKQQIMSNCLPTCAGIKHEKNNAALNSILGKLSMLTELIDKAN